MNKHGGYTQALYKYYKYDKKKKLVKVHIFKTKYVSTIDIPYGRYELR